jgi:ribosomal protein L11 methyltransferase
LEPATSTTALCIEWLGARAQVPIVDYGCGHGVLGIAALRLGARQVFAIDIDPQAVLATRQNAARNGVDDRLVIGPPPEGTASVLVANILAGPLIELAASITRLVAPRGEIALSGILVGQTEAVTAAYRPWFDIGLEGCRDDWALLGGRRGV